VQEFSNTFSDPRIVIGASDSNGAEADYNLRDTQEYEDLESRLRALEAEGPAAVDWPEVMRLCLFIIQSYGKDLVVGCWLTYALFRVEGYRGLAVGLGILREMIDRHWATMQPSVARKRARIGALEWLASRAAHLCTAEPGEDDAPAVLYAFDALGVIDQLVTERMTRDTFCLLELTRALAPHRDAIRHALAEAERRREEEEAARNRLPVRTPASPAKVITPPPVDPAAVEALPETLRTLSASLLGADTTDARAYEGPQRLRGGHGQDRQRRRHLRL
jgi:type VI secretion system protein VasJ